MHRVTVPPRLAHYLPIAQWLPNYDRANLRFDVMAALAVSALVIPQAMAYAQIAGLPPQAGIFGAFAAPLGYALFGTSRQLVCSPTSGMSALTAVIVAPAVVHDPAKYAPMAAALGIVCGLVFVLLGVLKLGFLSQLLSLPVQTGFLFGLGMTIIVGQLAHIVGVPSSTGPFYRQALDLLEHIGQSQGWTLAVGCAALAALVLLNRFVPRAPAALIVVAMAIVASHLLDLGAKGVPVVGHVERAFPKPGIPAVGIDEFSRVGPSLLAIVVIGYAEAITISKRFARKHDYEIRPNQELIGIGFACGFAGLFHGWVAGGGASQSAANDQAGAKTLVSTIALSGIILATALLFLPMFDALPIAVLAAVVIHAVRGFVDARAMGRLQEIDHESFLIAVLTMMTVLLIGILQGLVVGIGVSLLVTLLRFVKPTTTEVVFLPGGGLAAIDSYPRGEPVERMLIVRPDAALSYLNASWVRDDIRQRFDADHTGLQVLLLDLSETPLLDFTSLDTLNELVDDAASVGAELWLANVHERQRYLLDRSGFTQRVGGDRLFRTADDAWAAYRARYPELTSARN